MKWLWALALFTSQVWAFDPIDTGSLFPPWCRVIMATTTMHATRSTDTS